MWTPTTTHLRLAIMQTSDPLIDLNNENFLSVVTSLNLDSGDLANSVRNLLSTSEGRASALSLQGKAAVSFLDILQMVFKSSATVSNNFYFVQIVDSDRDSLFSPVLRGCLHKLARRSTELPSTLFISNITQEGKDPVSGGGYADIFKGNLSRVAS